MRLDEAFFSRDVLSAAPALVGMRICRRLSNGKVAHLRITEAEAYRGEEDEACHAHRGMTPRTRIMYEKGGFSYVYLVYGLHCLLNVVTGDAGQPQAALIRACEAPYNGPGKLTKALDIDRSLNGLWLPQSDCLWIEDTGDRPEITTAPRVGIAYAGEPWQSRPWRFIAGKE